MDQKTIEATERKLVPRLKYLGFVLILFSAIAFGWSFIPENASTESIEEELLADLEEIKPLNPYFVAAVLAAVGTLCVITSWRKKNAFASQDPDS